MRCRQWKGLNPGPFGPRGTLCTPSACQQQTYRDRKECMVSRHPSPGHGIRLCNLCTLMSQRGRTYRLRTDPPKADRPSPGRCRDQFGLAHTRNNLPHRGCALTNSNLCYTRCRRSTRRHLDRFDPLGTGRTTLTVKRNKCPGDSLCMEWMVRPGRPCQQRSLCMSWHRRQSMFLVRTCHTQ